MWVAGVIATASLCGVLIALFVASVVLAVIDKNFDANRIH